MTISQRIFYELKKQNKTQKQLSEFTGISTSTISAWNKNGTNPSADSIYPISQFLNISLEYLLTGNENSNIKQNVISTGDITGNHNANIVNNENNTDEMTRELIKAFRTLPFKDKMDIMNAVMKKSEQ